MKNQALFSSKDKSKKLKCCLLQFLFGALRVNVVTCMQYPKGISEGHFYNKVQSFMYTSVLGLFRCY